MTPESVAQTSNGEATPATSTPRESDLAQIAELRANGQLRRAAELVDEAIRASVTDDELCGLLDVVVKVYVEELKDLHEAEKVVGRVAVERSGLIDVVRQHAELLLRMGKPAEAVTALAAAAATMTDANGKGALLERMGDISLDALGRPFDAVGYFEAAAVAEPARRSAIRKATLLHLAEGSYIQAKRLLDVHAELLVHLAPRPVDEVAEVASAYEAVGEALLYAPEAHAIAFEALEQAQRLGANASRAQELLDELDRFPSKWKEHVRQLRDGALDARDKRDAARNYLSIAQIYRFFEPESRETVDQNIDKCLLLAPGYRPALQFLETLYRADGALASYVERLRGLVSGIRSHDIAVEVWSYIAELMAEQGESSDALTAVYEQIRTLDPRNQHAMQALTERFTDAGRYTDAAGVMESFLAQTSDNQAKRSTLRALARIYEIEVKDLQKAAASLEALRELGESGEALLQLAGLYERLEDDARLAGVLENLRTSDVVEQYSSRGETAVLETLLSLYETKLDEPEKAFATACRLFVRSPSTARESELRAMADRLGRQRDLGDTWLAAGDGHSDAVEARRLRIAAAHVYVQARATKQARPVLERLLADDPHDRAATELLDALLGQDADPEEWAKVLEARLKTAESDEERVRTMRALAEANRRMRKTGEQVRYLQAMLDIEPHHVDAMQTLESVLRQEERWGELGDILERRLALMSSTQDGEPTSRLRQQLAQLYDERLANEDAAADLYLTLLHDSKDNLDTLRALEKLQARGIRTVEIAEALQPYYAEAEAWRRHVDMGMIRRGAEEDAATRAQYSRAMAQVLEHKLLSPREAFDAWGAVLRDDPAAEDALQNVTRLADIVSGHPLLAEHLEAAADKLPDGGVKANLMARRAGLLQGVLGDQVAAIDAHRALLAQNPNHTPSLDALIELHTKREEFEPLLDALLKRLVLSDENDAAGFALKLGTLLLDQFEDSEQARSYLERALYGPAPLSGVVRLEAMRACIRSLERELARTESNEAAEALARTLSELAQNLAGKERAHVRTKLGDVYHRHLQRHHDALGAYEAALANDSENVDAESGARSLLDADAAPVATRKSAGRLLITRYQASGNLAGKVHVLQTLLALEENQAQRRNLVRDIVAILVQELDDDGGALELLLEHVASDPSDPVARQSAESLALRSGQASDLLDTWCRLRAVEDSALAQLYAERVIDVAERLQDEHRLAEGLQYILEQDPSNVALWSRLCDVKTSLGDHDGVAVCLTRLADVDTAHRARRLIELANHCFDVLLDAESGLQALRDARAADAADLSVLSELQRRLEDHERTEELAEVLAAKAVYMGNPADKAALYFRRGALLSDVLDQPDEAVVALTQALELERDGHSTAGVSAYLQRIARRDDQAGVRALDAIVDHHRAQQAWQPLVETLEIAAFKRAPGEERAVLLDEVSRLNEERLRVPQLAFRDACRAFREAPNKARNVRIHELADATGSFAELLTVLEDGARSLTASEPSQAIELFREVFDLAGHRLDDTDAQLRAANEILALDANDQQALRALEAIHRKAADSEALISVLERQAQTAVDQETRHNMLLELARLLVGSGQDSRAEGALRQIVHEDEQNDPALAALEQLYQRSGNSAAQVDILERRIRLLASSAERATLRLRLAQLKLTRRGDPAGALDIYALAVDDDPSAPTTRQAIQDLMEHARTHQTPPLADAAVLLERVLRAHQDWRALPAALEGRLQGIASADGRASLMLEIASVYEDKLSQPDFAFMWVCHAWKEMPVEGSLRDEAERLAQLTENEETLKELYEELLTKIADGRLRASMSRRIAEIAERVEGNSDEALTHLHAAVAAGATDLDTLSSLARLSRQRGVSREHADVLAQLAQAAVVEGEGATAKEAYAELSDVLEELGDVSGAVHAIRELLVVDGEDPVACATLERLLTSAQAWGDLAAFLLAQSQKSPQPEERAEILARLLPIQLSSLSDAAGAVATLEQMVECWPTSAQILPLGSGILQMLSADTRADAVGWRGRTAVILEPRYETDGRWEELIYTLRLRLDITDEPDERQRLWLRIVDLYERVLEQPEQALMALGKALGAAPHDSFLRDKAERISVRLGDLETLIGLFEDIAESLPAEEPLRSAYVIRCAELWEGGVGDPQKAALFYDAAFGLLAKAGGDENERRKVLERLERLLRVIGDPARLAQTLKRRVELVEPGPDAVAKVRQHLFEAATIEMRALQDAGAAIQTLKQLLETSPHDLAALRALAEACRQKERWVDLADALERQLVLQGSAEPERTHQIRFELGVVLDAHLQLTDDAFAHFQTILDADPNHAETRAYLEQRLESNEALRSENAESLQRSYERTGDWSKAVDVIRQQASEHERRGAHREAATLLMRAASLQDEKLGQAHLAFGTLCSAIKLDPGNAGLREQSLHLAEANELVEELCEIFEEEGENAEEAGRSALAAELREFAAALYVEPLHDIPRAIRAYEEILEKHPGRVASLEALTRLYGVGERFDELEKILRRRLMFIDDNAARVPLLVVLASTLADHLDRPDEAIPVLLEVRSEDPGHVVARRLLIDLYDAAEARQELRLLLEEELVATREASDREGLMRARGRLAVLVGDHLEDWNAAIPLWEEMHQEDAGAASAFEALERLYRLAERWTDLRTLYEQALARTRDPDAVAEVTHKLGQVLSLHLGGKDEAVQRHVKVLELDPRNQASLEALRELYRDLEQWNELVALLRRMMRLQTDPIPLKQLRFELAEVLGESLGKRAESVETGRRILDIEPHSDEELERLAAIFRQNEAFEELAGVLSRRAKTLSGTATMGPLLEMATVYEGRLSRPDEAAPAYSRVLEVEPDNEQAYARLNAIWSEAGEWNRLVALKEARVRGSEDVERRVELLREIGKIYEDRLAQREMAFLAACRAFRERFEDADIASWMDRLAVETDSVEELVAIYDDALGHLTDEERIIATHLRMAQLAAELLDELDDAEVHLKRVLEYQADHVEALERLAALYHAQERWTDEVAVLERKFDLATEVPARIDVLRNIAELLDAKAGDVDGAVAAYRRILDLDSQNIPVVRDLADLLERAQRWQPLIALLARQEELTDGQTEKLQLRYRVAGLWEKELENPDQAIVVHQSIVEEDPTFALSLKALERLNTSLGRGEDLIGVFEQMLNAASSDEEKIRLLGKISATWEETFENLPKAIDACDRTLVIDPKNVSAIRSLERLLRGAENYERLVDVLDRHIALSEAPQEIVELHLQLGDVQYRELGHTDLAEAAYSAALEFDPGSREALHALGQLYERSGNWFNALEKLTQEAQLAGASEEGVELYFRIGKINEEMLVDIGGAKEAYLAALDFDPGHLPSIGALKTIASKQKQYEDYLKWLRAEAYYTQDEDARVEIHTTTGLFLQDHAGDIDGAAEEFEKALALRFDHLPAAKPLADICFRNQAWERTEQLLEIVIDQLVGTASAAELVRYQYRLGYVCEKLGKDGKALKHYQRAYEVDATYLPGLEGLGASLNRAGRYDDAAKIYQAILIHHRDSLTDAEVVDYYQQLADVHRHLKEYDRALKNLGKALEIDSAHVASLRLLAQVQLDERRYEETYEAYMRLIPLLAGKERVEVLVRVGQLCVEELDDPYRAIDAYEDANRQLPQDGEILRSLLDLYRQSKQGVRAAEVLEELVRIEQDPKSRVRLNQVLGEVYRDDLKNESRAVQYFNAALDLDPTYLKAFQAAEEMLASNANWAGLEQLYLLMLRRLTDEQTAIKREIWKNLAGLYRHRLKNLESATQAYTVLHKLEPDNLETLDALADLQTRSPAMLDEAIVSYQKLLVLLGDKPGRALHALVRLYHHRRLADRAFMGCAALQVLGDLQPDEAQLYQHYQRLQPAEPRAAMTQKLWDALLLHPAAQGPLYELSDILWRTSAAVLGASAKDLGLDKKRAWHKEELDAPVPTFFVSQLKKVRAAMGLGNFDLYIQRQAVTPLTVLPTDIPSLAVGEGSDVFREMPDRQLRFLCARQVAYFRPAFLLSRALGPQRFLACIEAAVRLVEPRYPSTADPREVQEFERQLQRLGPPLLQAIRGPVTQLLAAQRVIDVRPYLEGVEHTAVRAAYLVTGHLELAAQILKQPDVSPLPLAYGVKMRELLNFVISEPHFELRQRLGMAVAG